VDEKALGAAIFAGTLGAGAGSLSFGMAQPGGLPPNAIAATDAAFAAIAFVTSALSLISGVIAWFTLERRI
jgi:uncharacterized membrane protein YfcA